MPSGGKIFIIASSTPTGYTVNYRCRVDLLTTVVRLPCTWEPWLFPERRNSHIKNRNVRARRCLAPSCVSSSLVEPPRIFSRTPLIRGRSLFEMGWIRCCFSGRLFGGSNFGLGEGEEVRVIGDFFSFSLKWSFFGRNLIVYCVIKTGNCC